MGQAAGGLWLLTWQPGARRASMASVAAGEPAAARSWAETWSNSPGEGGPAAGQETRRRKKQRPRKKTGAARLIDWSKLSRLFPACRRPVFGRGSWGGLSGTFERARAT